MTDLSPSRALMHRVAGSPDVSCRVASDPPLVLDRHHALFEVASVPPLSAPVLFIHIGGKPLSYRAGRQDAEHQSLPGLVTLIPRAVRAEVALRGVGEGALIYFENERRVPDWLSKPAPREPVTFLDGVLASLARQILSSAGAGRRDEKYLAALANALLAQLRHVLTHPVDADRPRGSRSGLLIARTAIQYIHQYLDAALTVQQLANECGLGVTHFSSTFKQTTGVTPHSYVRAARIERACELLRTTSLTIGEIAHAVGFSGQSHFCTAFTRERGITPSAYRQGLRKPAGAR